MIKKKEWSKVYGKLKAGAILLTHLEKTNMEELFLRVKESNVTEVRYQDAMDFDSNDKTQVKENKKGPHPSTIRVEGKYHDSKITHYVKSYS